MDPFSSPSPSGGLSGSSEPSAEVIMDQVKNQLAQAYAEELLESEQQQAAEEEKQVHDPIVQEQWMSMITKGRR